MTSDEVRALLSEWDVMDRAVERKPEPLDELVEDLHEYGQRLANALREARKDAERLQRFAGRVIGDEFFSYGEIDLIDVEGWAVEAGLMERTKATAEDATQDWAQEWGIEEGDDCTKITAFGQAAIDAAREGEE